MMNRRPPNLHTGFTLLETVVVLGLSVAAFAAITNIFFIFNTTYGYQQAFMAAAGSAGASMNAFEAAVLPASQVLSSHDFNGTTHASATTTLVLELPSLSGSGEVIPGVKDYVAFYASSTELYRVVEADANSARASGVKKLSTTLQTLSFTYDNVDVAKATSVAADIQTQAQFKEHVVQSRLSLQVYLRNAQPTP